MPVTKERPIPLPWSRWFKKGTIRLLSLRWKKRAAIFEVLEPFTVYKKVYAPGHANRKSFVPKTVVIPLTLPKGTRFVAQEASEKCRATEVIARGDGCSEFDTKFHYRNGRRATPNGFTESPVQCGKGIHFFRTQRQARAY